MDKKQYFRKTSSGKNRARGAIVIVGTLDTKGAEVDYLRVEIERSGHRTIVIDSGVLGKPQSRADITRGEVAETGGRKLSDLVKEAKLGADRVNTLQIMMCGLACIVKELYSSGKIGGIICVGGSTGTALGSASMKVLPLGVPKMSVSTTIFPKYFGETDIVVMQTPSDIMGLNTILRKTLSQAAGAIIGMVDAELPTQIEKPLVAVTALGVTTPAVLNIQPLLCAQGYEMISFHAKSEVLDHLVEQDTINGVIDLTSFEIIRIFVYPGQPERQSRLDSTLRKGIPLIICPGGLDMIILRIPINEIPIHFKDRKLHRHGPQVTLIRTDKREMVRAAQVIAGKINKAQGPVAVVFPRRGFSEVDREGSIFYDPETDAVFMQELKNRLADGICFKDVDCHINDKRFAKEVSVTFDQMYRNI